MAESIEKYANGRPMTCAAGAAITGARFVSITAAPTSGNPTVQHTGAAAKVFGVSCTDAASGAIVAVHHNHGDVVEVEAGTGGVAAGEVVEAAATGVAITRASGIPAGTCTLAAAAGAKALIKLNPAGI